MNKTRTLKQILILSAVFFFSTAVTLHAQGTLTLGGGIGVTSAVSDMNGSTMEYYNGSRYGLTSGLNILAKAKAGFGGMDLAVELDYSSLNSQGNSEPGQGAVELTQNILSLKLGPEMHFAIPGLPFSPYAGVNAAWNRFSGETKFQGVAKIPSAVYSVREATRLGAGITLGAEVNIAPFILLDLSTAYNFLNLSGAEWQDVNPAVNQRLDSYLALNDARDPFFAAGDDKHMISTDRSLRSMHFTVSLLFGI